MTAGEAIDAALSSRRLSAMRAALRAIEAQGERGKPFTLSIARTFTIETQVDALSFALALVPCAPMIHIGDYGVVEPLLFDADSPLLAAKPDAVLVLWRLEDIYPELVESSGGWTAERRREAFQALSDRMEQLCSGYGATAQAPLFLSTFPLPRHVSASDAAAGFGIAEITARLNAELYQLAASSDRVYVFDFAAWAARTGQTAFDAKLDLYARQPISSDALASFAFAVGRSLRPLIVPPLKVLAVDLDNVLWGGVLGEDGIDSLKIGRDFPGSVYRRIQLAALDLKSRGILLALVSKNNYEDVVEAFARLADMPLQLKDFAAVRVNWESKSSNLAAIAEELNLGIDTFAFLDDQPFEREDVRHQLPAVHVIDAGSDPLNILHALQATDVFDSLRVTQADRTRSADYSAQRERRVHQSNGSRAEFFESLQLRAEIVELSEAGIERAAQMLAKTNQFNVSTRRHTAADLRRMVADPRYAAFTMALRDRFGDQGVIALAIAAFDPAAEELFVDTFLMSCRALGRGAEDALWARLIDHASERRAKTLRAEYIATEKNRQVAELFDRFGMKRLREAAGICEYKCSMPLLASTPSWIKVCDPAMASG